MMWLSTESSLRSACQMSLNDPLTHLYNRQGFVGAADALLQGAARFDRWACLLALQVNRSNVIDQAMSGEAADKLLILAAQCLREALGRSAVIGRTSPHRFAVLWVAEKCNDCSETVGRLAATIDRHHARERQTDLPVVGGYIKFKADFPVSVDDLLNDADRQVQTTAQRSSGSQRW